MMQNSFKTAAILVFCSLLTLSLNAQVEELKHKSEPQDVSYVDNAPHTLRHTDTINASIDKVWEVISDYEMWLKWFPNLKACDFPSGKTGLNEKRNVQMGKIKMRENIILWEPEKAFGFTVLESNRKLVKSLVELLYIEPIDQNTTKIIYKGGVEYAGMLKLLQNYSNKRFTKSWEEAFENIAELIENK